MSSDPTTTPDDDLPTGERLQKVMAAAGVASRRVSEDLIAAGRVTVNGKVVTEAGRRIDPERDKVVVDGAAVQLDTTRRYVMLNKPVGVVSTMSDEADRPDLRQFTSDFEERLFNVGRLDVETSGLLLLTNDGELAHVLAHPSFGVTKTYIAKVRGVVTPAVLAQLLAGVDLEDGPIAADRATVVAGGAGLSRSADSSLVEITLHSGRNRIVRRMMEEVGHPVIDLVRRSFGPLHLGTLKAGHVRSLNKTELGAILTIARDASPSPKVDSVPTIESGDAPVDEADVVEVALDADEVEKEFYDEDDDEYDPETDARDARRRVPGAGPRAGVGKGDAPVSRRAEVRREQAGRREQGADRGDRGGRPVRDDRAGRPERGGYLGRDDRADRADRGDRGGYAAREDRGGYAPRADRPGSGARGGASREDRGGRPERGGYQGRDDRGGRPAGGGYQGRDDRRDDRGGRPERGGYQGRDDRGGRPAGGGYQGRDDRGARPERGGFVSRDDRGGRPDRGGYVSRDDRGGAPRGGDRPLSPGEERAAGYPNRDLPKDPRTGRPSGVRAGGPGSGRGGREDRSARDGDDRGGYQGRDDRGGRPAGGGYQGRDDRGARDDRGGRPERGGYQGRDDRGGRPAGSGYQGRDDRGGRPAGGGYQGRDDRGGRPAGGGYQGRDDRGGRPAGGGYQGRDDRGGRPAGGGYQGRDDRSGRDDRGGRPERGGDRPFRGRPDDGGRGPRGGGRS